MKYYTITGIHERSLRKEKRPVNKLKKVGEKCGKLEGECEQGLTCKEPFVKIKGFDGERMCEWAGTGKWFEISHMKNFGILFISK